MQVALNMLPLEIWDDTGIVLEKLNNVFKLHTPSINPMRMLTKTETPKAKNGWTYTSTSSILRTELRG
jgi:hypothetical protein